MPLEANPELLEAGKSLLLWLGAQSLLGLLSLYGAWLAFPPELVVESVVDKSNTFGSESRIKIKNIGRLPALKISADVENIWARIGTNTLKDVGIFSDQPVVGRLAHNETAEILITPGVGIGPGIQISEFSYLLTLKHRATLFFLSKGFRKQWRVELRTFHDGYAWHIVPA